MQNMILEVTTALAVAVITGTVAVLVAFLQGKIKSDRINSSLTRLESLSAATVHELRQDLVDVWKEKNGGSLSDEQIATLRKISLTKIRNLLDDPAAELIHSVGMDLDSLIQAFVEKAVVCLKKP